MMYNIVSLNNRGDKHVIGLICIHQASKLFRFKISNQEVEIFNGNHRWLRLLVESTIQRYQQNLAALQKDFEKNGNLGSFHELISHENGIINFSKFREVLPNNIRNQFEPFLAEAERIPSTHPAPLSCQDSLRLKTNL